jgi:non-heme chloroperoxidase
MDTSTSNVDRRDTAAEQATNLLRSNTQTSDGVTINFVETGNPAGPPILFVHGISQSWRSWEKQLDDGPLRDKFRLIALDLRGHGESQGAQGAVDTAGRSLPPLDPEKYNDGTPEGTARLWAGDIAAVIAARHLSNVTLVGWSYGGVVVLDYLATTADLGSISKAVLVATAPVVLPPGTADGGADQVFTERAIGALMRTLPVDPSSSPPQENAPSDIVGGLAELMRACASDDTGRPPMSDDEIEAMASRNALSGPDVRLGIISRSFDYRPFLAQLPGNMQESIKVITPSCDRVLQVSNISTYWPSSGIENHPVDGEGHFFFWRNPNDFNERLMRLIG